MEDDILNYAVETANENAGPVADNVLNQWLNPGLQQRIEFGQQVALTKYQNEWNSEGAKMKRMTDAGINPYLAAQGIAGVGGSTSQVAAAPNSAVGAGASSVGAASQALGSAAQAAGVATDAIDRFSTLSGRKEKLHADTVQALEAAGLSKWEAKAIATLLPDRQKNLRADTYLKLGQYRNTVAEYRNIRKEYDVKVQQIDTMKKQADLYRKQGDLAKATELRVQAETAGIDLDNWWKQTDKQFWLDHGYRPDDEMDIALRNAAANGHDVDVEKVGDAIENYSYRERKGFNTAEIEDVYSKVFEEIKANAAWKPYLSRIEAHKQHLIDIVQTQLENPDDLRGFVAKLMNLIGSLFGVSNLESSNVVAGATPPKR